METNVVVSVFWLYQSPSGILAAADHDDTGNTVVGLAAVFLWVASCNPFPPPRTLEGDEWRTLVPSSHERRALWWKE